MQLVEPVPELNRTNCVRLMLKSFQASDAVKALVFMPGATDEFYMFRRARARLNGGSPTLLDAVAALTNQTYIRASYQKPLLLLHTDEDPMQPSIRFEGAGLEESWLPSNLFHRRALTTAIGTICNRLLKVSSLLSFALNSKL